MLVINLYLTITYPKDQARKRVCNKTLASSPGHSHILSAAMEKNR